MDWGKLKITFSSEPDYEFLVANVFYDEKFLYFLHPSDTRIDGIDIIISRSDRVANPFTGSFEVGDFIEIASRAREAYRHRMVSPINPMIKS